MREFDAYLFDADGTLLDTRELIYQSYVCMAKDLEIPTPDRGLIERTTGIPLVEQLREVLGGDLPPEAYKRANRAYVDHMMVMYREYLGTFPGVPEGLAALADAGKKLAVVTSRKRHTLELFLEVLELRPFFSVLVTPEDTERHKPHPEPAILAMRSLEADPGTTVFVGDAEYDIRCGNAAGVATAFVAWGGMNPSGWPVAPDFAARRFRDLLPDGKEEACG